MNILAIDQGTSSTKALVIADDNEILAEASVTVHPRATGDGQVEQDPQELWESVVGAGRAALAQAGATVAAIGLANQGETVLRWDRGSGRPLGPALSWQDRRAAPICDRLRTHGDELTAITGLPLDPYFSAPKMAWLREHDGPDGVLTTTDSWLLHRLTGALVTDAATASRALLLDLDQLAWSARACELFGLDHAALPAIVPCAGVVGETTVFGPALPVAGLAVDQQAALFAESCIQPGDAKCTYGTGAFLLMTVGGKARRSQHGLAACVAWSLAGHTSYCLDGQVYTAGAAISWLQQIGLISAARDLDRIAGGVDSTAGVVFVPALAGLAAPFWRPAARGAFTGLSLASERGHLVRAVLEGVAAAVAGLGKAAAQDSGQPLTRLRVDGGLTQSAVLMQIQADLLQVPLELYSSPHATALGVGALARLGMGSAGTPEEAIGHWQPAAVYEPAIAADRAAERLAQWQRVVEQTLAP